MSFLDESGLAYFYSKIKNLYTRSVNRIKPVNGNVSITNIEAANNLLSPDNTISYDAYIYRTTGGSLDTESGQARLLYIEGNTVAVDRVNESISLSITNDLTATVDASVWRNSTYGNSSNVYYFSYDASSGEWSPSIANTGITVNDIHSHEISISKSGSITNATVDITTWETVITTSGVYNFIYNNGWYLNSNAVNLAGYGISITGSPANDDSITVSYTAATPNSILTVTYVKSNRGTLIHANPTSFEASGLNQYDKNTMTLSNMTITNNVIASENDKYICYCRAIGGLTNGYVAYSESGAILDIGWCATIPAENSTIYEQNNNVTSTLASIEFEDTGYVVVAATSINDICIHPRWSGRADYLFSEYASPTTIEFPTSGVLNGATTTLPLAIYGMPSIGSIADKLDLDKQVYIQNIARIPYSVENLASTQLLNVEYDYDNLYIYYVLSEPLKYDIEISPVYFSHDFGTEEFIYTSVPVYAYHLYGENLREKLRLEVENKKLYYSDIKVGVHNFNISTTSSDITNITVNQDTWHESMSSIGTYIYTYTNSNWIYSEEVVDLTELGISFEGTPTEGDIITIIVTYSSNFSSNNTYEDYPYRYSIVLSEVEESMVPQVILGLEEAACGNYAPVSYAYNGGIYIYAKQRPTDLFTIPSIICWKDND